MSPVSTPSLLSPISEPVLEVAQSVGDSVDSVHLLCADDPEPKVSRRLLAGIGIACLVVSALAFGRSVSVSAANERAYHQWVEVDRKPVAAYRPARLSIAHDFFAFGGLGAALLLFGGALAVRRRLPESLRAGSGEGDAIAIAEVPSFELVRVTGSAATVSLPVGVVATVTGTDGTETEASGQVILSHGESMRAAHGLANLHLRWTGKPKAAPLGSALSFDSRTSKFIAASALAHLAVLALLMMIPPDARAMSFESDRLIPAVAKMTIDAQEDDVVPPSDGADGEAGKAKLGEEVASVAGDKGNPEAIKEKTKASIKRRSDEVHLARITAKEAREFGIAGLLREDHFVSFAATDPFASGLDIEDRYGNDMSASDLGEGRGPGGSFGTPNGKGIAPFGGEWGIIKSGPYGKTIGDPNGRGNDYGTKIGGTGTRKHVSRNPIIVAKPASCGVAGCDKALIGRYIRKQKRRIRNCYERALIADNGLSGTVVARFLIHPDGKVSRARASGMGVSSLHSCITRVVSSIKFPVVADGVVASVSYPFVLNLAGK